MKEDPIRAAGEILELALLAGIINPREHDILVRRCLRGESLETVGKAIKQPVTRERVRQLQNIALSKLRRASLYLPSGAPAAYVGNPGE